MRAYSRTRARGPPWTGPRNRSRGRRARRSHCGRPWLQTTFQTPVWLEGNRRKWASQGGRSPVTTAGVIGLGDIGQGVADAVVRAGLDLGVCDLRPRSRPPSRRPRLWRPSRPLSGPGRDVVVVAVVDDRQVLAVLDGADGALGAMAAGSTVVILSTVSPRTVEAVAAAASAPGCRRRRLRRERRPGRGRRRHARGHGGRRRRPSSSASAPSSTPSPRSWCTWARSGPASRPSWPATSCSTGRGWRPTRRRCWPRRPGSSCPSWPR